MWTGSPAAKSTTEIYAFELQLLGLVGLGSAGGFERLHFLLESAFDGPHLTTNFLIVSSSQPHLSLQLGGPT